MNTRGMKTIVNWRLIFLMISEFFLLVLFPQNAVRFCWVIGRYRVFPTVEQFQANREKLRIKCQFCRQGLHKTEVSERCRFHNILPCVAACTGLSGAEIRVTGGISSIAKSLFSGKQPLNVAEINAFFGGV